MSDPGTHNLSRKGEGCDIALIGHLEAWKQVHRYLQELGKSNPRRLADEDAERLYSFIPPRKLFDLEFHSHPGGKVSRAVYIDTFIPPGELELSFAQRNLQKVKRAAECAVREGAKVASLGGFSSILLEGDVGQLASAKGCAFTTGNTLTSAFIVAGIEKVCAARGKPLDRLRLLVIGSTGDIGSACVDYFKHKFAEIILCAREKRRLAKQEAELAAQGVRCYSTEDPETALPTADVVLSVASVPKPTFVLKGCKPDVIVCDAGYPKNIRLEGQEATGRLFYGGMGYARGGYHCESPLLYDLLGFPDRKIAHGCMLEGALLALEGRHESFSVGRGNIKAEKISECWEMARKNGFELAPFYNHEGLWADPL